MALSTKFWKLNVCWHHPVMLCLFTSSKLFANNLNFLWRWRWWDWIQSIFLIYFTLNFRPRPARRESNFSATTSEKLWAYCPNIYYAWLSASSMGKVSSVKPGKWARVRPLLTSNSSLLDSAETASSVTLIPIRFGSSFPSEIDRY